MRTESPSSLVMKNSVPNSLSVARRLMGTLNLPLLSTVTGLLMLSSLLSHSFLTAGRTLVTIRATCVRRHQKKPRRSRCFWGNGVFGMRPPCALEASRPQSAFGSLDSFWLLTLGVQNVKRSFLERLRPIGEIIVARPENDLKAKIIVIRNVGQPPPRSVPQQRCRDDHLKPAGFGSLTTRRNAICPFRGEPFLPENVLQPFRVRVILTDDQDSSPIRDSQLQPRRGADLVGGFWGLCSKTHGAPPFVCRPILGRTWPCHHFIPTQFPCLLPISPARLISLDRTGEGAEPRPPLSERPRRHTMAAARGAIL